jgi:SAM-dependent methyltransferase
VERGPIGAADARALSAGPAERRRLAAQIRRSRLRPRPTQSDYLHLRRLRDDVREALAAAAQPIERALDLFCGACPYQPLLPPTVRWTSLDVEDTYGLADVVTQEFLPFADGAFDLVLCTEAFHYLADPESGVREIGRVLRPGGTAIVTVPLVWPYDRDGPEGRYTAAQLRRLFAGWDAVRVVEDGGRVVAWATLTGWLLRTAQLGIERRVPVLRAARPGFAAAYALLSGAAVALERLDERAAAGRLTLPANLLLSARRPRAG